MDRQTDIGPFHRLCSAYAGSANKRHISKEIELDMFRIAKVNNT